MLFEFLGVLVFKGAAALLQLGLEYLMSSCYCQCGLSGKQNPFHFFQGWKTAGQGSGRDPQLLLETLTSGLASWEFATPAPCMFTLGAREGLRPKDGRAADLCTYFQGLLAL